MVTTKGDIIDILEKFKDNINKTALDIIIEKGTACIVKYILGKLHTEGEVLFYKTADNKLKINIVLNTDEDVMSTKLYITVDVYNNSNNIVSYKKMLCCVESFNTLNISESGIYSIISKRLKNTISNEDLDIVENIKGYINVK